MKNLRVAVVGVGYLGRFHAQKYRMLKNVTLVGVCDLNSTVGQSVAQECATEFFSNHTLLANKVDAVTISANTSAHFDLARFFLERGVHVLLEKPMTATSQEGTNLTKLADDSDLKLQVGHVERFNPALLAAKKRLSDVQFIECHRLAPFKVRGAEVNVVLDLMIHDLDVILSLVGGKPINVSAVGIRVLTDSIDIANARIEFDTGAVANVTSSRVSQNAQRKFRVFQHKQYLSIDFEAGDLNLITYDDSAKTDEDTLKNERWSLEKEDALLAEVSSFTESILENRPCQVPGLEGVLALELAETIMHAINHSVAS